MQSNGVRDVVKLFAADGFQRLAAVFQLLVDLDGLLGHLLVRVLAAAYEGKVIPFGHALVTIRIQSHAKHHRFGFAVLFGRFRHVFKLRVESQSARHNRQPQVFNISRILAEAPFRIGAP